MAHAKKNKQELIDRSSLKKLKFFRGHDGQDGFSAELYIDGAFICEVLDDAWGGGVNYQIGDYAKLKAIESEYDLTSPPMFKGEDPIDLGFDTIIDALVNQHKIKKDAKKGIVFKEPNGWSIWGFGVTIPTAIKRWGKEPIKRDVQKQYDKYIQSGKEILNKAYLKEELGIRV